MKPRNKLLSHYSEKIMQEWEDMSEEQESENGNPFLNFNEMLTPVLTHTSNIIKGRQEERKRTLKVIDNMVDYGEIASEDDYGDIWLPIDLLKQKIDEEE